MIGYTLVVVPSLSLKDDDGDVIVIVMIMRMANDTSSLDTVDLIATALIHIERVCV